MSLLRLNNVSVKKRLYAFSEEIHYGERIHIIGANGAGKSTLLMTISGDLRFDGDIVLNGISIKHYKYRDLSRMQSIVVQQINALPFMPVFQYLLLYQSLSTMNNIRLNELLKDFQVDNLLTKNVQHLSGGEWQRVRIVAALIQVWSSDQLNGKLLLLDEPTNNLDIVQLAILDKWLDKFCQQGGAVIMSTHDLHHSYIKAHKIWLMLEGKLINSGSSTFLLNENLLSLIFNAKIRCIKSSKSINWHVFT